MYRTHAIHMFTHLTCVQHTLVYSINLYYMCRNTVIIHTCIADTCIIYIFYTCNTHKTPHMYYRNGMYKEGWRGIKSNDASQGAMV